jgi:hypothetical protein
MTSNARMGLAIVGFLLLAGVATFACAERGPSESDEGSGSKKNRRSEKGDKRGHRTRSDKSPGSPMEQNKGSEEMTADKGQAIETP